MEHPLPDVPACQDKPRAARTMRQLPAEDRPRERLARHGTSALSNRELVAILLGTGARGASASPVDDKPFRVLGDLAIEVV